MTEPGTLPEHISYSQLTTYMKCGKQFFFSRIARLPEKPAWWNVGGRAVHAASEQVCARIEDGGRYTDTEIEAITAECIDKEVAHLEEKYGVPKAEFRLPARGGTEDWWRKEAPLMVQRWQHWRTEGDAKDWKLAQFPQTNGDSGVEDQPGPKVPAVELSLLVSVTDEAPPLKAFVDRVFVLPDGRYAVVDLKTGSKIDKGSLQLGVYRALILKAFGVNATVGGYWSGRKGELAGYPLRDLSRYTPDLLGLWCGQFWRAVQAGIFMPVPSDLCGYCSFKEHCVSYGGDRAWGFDPDVAVFSARQASSVQEVGQ